MLKKKKKIIFFYYNNSNLLYYIRQETIELDQMNYYLTGASFAFLAGILLIYLFCCRGPIDKVI
jgi:hypothetical protein